MFNFAPASALDSIVYGSCRPGVGRVQTIPSESVEDWIDFMKSQGISRVVVLLHQHQLDYYKEDLLATYRRHFTQVTWAPIPDFQIPDLPTLRMAIQALREAEQAGEKVVVHCSAGMGRTGLVLAAWLMLRHGQSAIQAAHTVVTHATACDAVRIPSEAPDAMELLESLKQEEL